MVFNFNSRVKVGRATYFIVKKSTITENVDERNFPTSMMCLTIMTFLFCV